VVIKVVVTNGSFALVNVIRRRFAPWYEEDALQLT